MPPRKEKTPEISMKNTKQELLTAYNSLLEKMEDMESRELRPEKKIQEKKKEEVLACVADLTTHNVVQNIAGLKMEIANTLSQLSEKLETEVGKLNRIQEAIELKERELKDIYEIDKCAATLAALIEAQHQQRDKFSQEMEDEKTKLLQDIETTRKKWQKEKEDYEQSIQEQQAAEAKKREREKEEYKYAFQREQQIAKDKQQDEKAKLIAEKEKIEKEMTVFREQTEKELEEREKIITEKEEQFEALQKQVQEYPKKLELALSKAIKETSERIKKEADYQKTLQEKQYEGEKKVLHTRIEALEKTLQEKNEQIAKLAEHQELAYQKVQDVAVKAIDGASKFGSFSGLQQILSEQGTRQAGEK